MTRNSLIGDVFDEMSNEYDDVMDSMVPHYRKLLSAMFEYLPPTFTPKSIMDLGCGNGNPALVAKALYPDARIHLVDASDEMLTLCRGRLGEGDYEFTQDLFQDLTVKNEAFDLVYAGFSLHHLDKSEKPEFFRKVFAGLKPGGIFTCADLFIDKDEDIHPAHLLQWREFCRSKGKSDEDWDWLMAHYDAYDRPSSFSDQDRWLREAGFSEARLTWNIGQWGCFHALKQ